MRKWFLSMATAALTLFAFAAQAAVKLKVGVLATLEGTYTVLGEDGVRGFKTALGQFKNIAGGREIEVIIGATDASPDSAVRAARNPAKQDKVDIVIGPLSGSEGIAVKNYAKSQPQVTFITGISGAQGTTFSEPAAGLACCTRELHWLSPLATSYGNAA